LSNGSPVSTVSDGQLTAENLSLEVGDVLFVYRRFGNEETAAPALVMLQTPGCGSTRTPASAGHGFLNQYPEQFADDVHAFLET
jgi:hypothetical protein